MRNKIKYVNKNVCLCVHFYIQFIHAEVYLHYLNITYIIYKDP